MEHTVLLLNFTFNHDRLCTLFQVQQPCDRTQGKGHYRVMLGSIFWNWPDAHVGLEQWYVTHCVKKTFLLNLSQQMSDFVEKVSDDIMYFKYTN